MYTYTTCLAVSIYLQPHLPWMNANSFRKMRQCSPLETQAAFNLPTLQCPPRPSRYLWYTLTMRSFRRACRLDWSSCV